MAQERSDLKKYDRNDVDDPSMRTARNDSSELNFRDSSKTEGLTNSDDDQFSSETENIKGQIEETRNQMGETIDAIQDKLSFSNISEQVSDHVHNAVETAKEAVYTATIGKAADMMKNVSKNLTNSTVVRTAKDNPLPFILIGAGVGLLAYKGFSGSFASDRKRENFENHRYPKQPLAESESGTIGQMSDKVSATAEMAVDKISTVFDSASSGAADMKDRVYERAGEFKDVAIDKYETYLNDNPLALGAAALALGAAVGMAIPATMYESELMGETRDNVLGKAQESAAGLLDKGKKAIMDAGHTALPQKGSLAEH